MSLSSPQLIVLLDAACAPCSSWARRLIAWDHRRRLQIRSMYEPGLLLRYGINPDRARLRLHVVAPGARDASTVAVLEGIDAVIAIARAVPVLWLALPMLWTLRWLGIGQLGYDLVASRRYRGMLK